MYFTLNLQNFVSNEADVGECCWSAKREQNQTKSNFLSPGPCAPISAPYLRPLLYCKL